MFNDIFIKFWFLVHSCTACSKIQNFISSSPSSLSLLSIFSFSLLLPLPSPFPSSSSYRLPTPPTLSPTSFGDFQNLHGNSFLSPTLPPLTLSMCYLNEPLNEPFYCYKSLKITSPNKKIFDWMTDITSNCTLKTVTQNSWFSIHRNQLIGTDSRFLIDR